MAAKRKVAAKKKVQAEEESLPVKEKPAKRARGPANPRKQQALVVKGLLSKAAETLKKGAAVKATLGDYIKLVQLQKDLAEDEPRDIKVGWVDRLSHLEDGPDEEKSGEK